MGCEQLEQAGVRDATIKDNNTPHAFFQRFQGGFRLGDHAACDHAFFGHCADVFRCQGCQNLALGILDAGHIGQQQKPCGFERAGDGTCGCIAVDVEGFLGQAACRDGGHNGDDACVHHIAQHLHVHFDGATHPAQFRIIRFADHQIVVFARQTNRTATFIHDRLNDAFVDQTGQHHFNDLNGGFVGHTLAAHELRLDAKLIQHFVDHRAAAMNDDRVHANLLHQHDVAGECGHRFGVAHGVATEFHHHRRAGIALHVGKSLG